MYNYFYTPPPKDLTLPDFSHIEIEPKSSLPSPCISITHCVSLSKKEHIQELRKQFKEKTEYGLNASKKFLNNKSWVNDTKWKMGKIERNLNTEWKDRYIKTLQVWKEIEYNAKSADMIPIFFTGTVIGELHPFSAGSDIRKKEWDTNKLKLAYQELQSLHTKIRKQAYRTFGYSPDFIRAVEYHKSYMPHTHIVYFVRTSEVQKFLKIIENKENENKNIGRTETKVIHGYDTEKHYSPVSYLLKYLKKNIADLANNPKQEELEIFNGWKNTLGIKQLYNNSIFRIPKWAMKKISWHYKDFAKMGYRSMIEAIEAEVEIITESIQIDKTIKTNIINSPKSPKYKIYRKTERYTYITEEEDTKLADRILEYFIYDNNGVVLFDKQEYKMLEDTTLPIYKEKTKIQKLIDIQTKIFLDYEAFINFIEYDKYEIVNNLIYSKTYKYCGSTQYLEYDTLPSGCA